MPTNPDPGQGQNRELARTRAGWGMDGRQAEAQAQRGQGKRREREEGEQPWGHRVPETRLERKASTREAEAKVFHEKQLSKLLKNTVLFTKNCWGNR